MARYSYVLNENDVYWCIEWNPGLIVVRFSPKDEMAWTAIRSPVPNFGGREADESDWDDYDEDADNHQYNLIFDPWDAQFDGRQREQRLFVPADSGVQSRFENAIASVYVLSETLEQQFSKDLEAWAKLCIQNLEEWNGEGIRIL